jgi:hypothetical protein
VNSLKAIGRNSVPLLYHLEAIERERELRHQQRYEAQQAAMTAAFAAAEVARAVKERADRDAMKLDRITRAYKDEKANNLREQLGSERGLMATKDDLQSVIEKFNLTLGPVLTYIASQQGRSSGLDKGWAILISVSVLIATVLGIVAFFSK